ncbi:MAG TPA: hypothetical protein VIK62_04325 [Verrucomicrobiae bacterium]
MKKLILAAVALCCAATITVQAQDTAPKKHKLTAEQQTVMTEMLAKYDTNKDGKLDKTEKSAMTADDKAAWAKAFPMKGKKKSAEATAATPAPDTTK